MHYFNDLNEPNGQVIRNVTLLLPDVVSFQPCMIDITVLNLPDPPHIFLPDE